MFDNYDETPIISCIVPVYNVEKYLRRCVDSILNQTFSDFELILVDDGSPDNSPTICDEYAKKDSRVRVIHKVNGGSAYARRIGTENARGNFLYFCDGDDWLENDLLESFYNTTISTNADIIGCDLVKEYGNYSKVVHIPLPENPLDALIGVIQGAIPGWLPVKFFKASLFNNQDCRWIDGINVCEDFLITVKLFYYAKKISYIPEVLYHYECSNTSSLTYSLSNEKIEQINTAYDEVCKFLEGKQLKNRFADELQYRKFCDINWISICSKKINKNYLLKFSDEKFFENKYMSLPYKIFAFLCYKKLLFIPSIFIKLKRIRGTSK